MDRLQFGEERTNLRQRIISAGVEEGEADQLVRPDDEGHEEIRGAVIVDRARIRGIYL